jgi:hypothetical protein
MGIAGRTHQTPTAAAATNIPRRVGADNVLNIDRSSDMINTISRAWDRAAAPTSTGNEEPCASDPRYRLKQTPRGNARLRL